MCHQKMREEITARCALMESLCAGRNPCTRDLFHQFGTALGQPLERVLLLAQPDALENAD